MIANVNLLPKAYTYLEALDENLINFFINWKNKSQLKFNCFHIGNETSEKKQLLF